MFSSMKSLVLLSLSAIVVISSTAFAQTLPGRNGAMLSNPQAGNQRFFQQTRVNTQYTQSQCVGAYSNQRYYLSGDRDGDTLPDSYDPLYLKDNFAIVGNNNNTYRLALILPTFNNFVGTEVFYHTPISGSNALSLRTNNQNYSLANNNAWFRLSKVAPLNQRVRAVTSEPILLEIPASRNPQDAYAQVAYQIRYVTYRDHNWPLSSGYQVFPVANSGDFGVPSSWFLNTNYPSTANGPLWPNHYTQTLNAISTNSITRSQWEQTHALECKNYYTSRCGNGYRDISGQQPTNGSQTLPYALAAGGGVNEQCDPGTPWVTSPYIPAWQPVGTTCSQTCTLVLPQVVQYVDPIIIKSQRNITRNTPSTGQYMTGVLSYSSGNQIEYRVIISNPSTILSTHTGISLREQLPAGFVYATTNPVTIVTGGIVTPTTVTYNTATHQSSAFQLAPWASVTFFIRGTLLTNSPTTRTNIANLYVWNIEIVDSHVVMNYNTPLTPSLAITKYQRIRPWATNYIMSGSLPNGSAFVTTPLTWAVGDMIDYRLQITNTGAWTAYLSTIVDNAINATIPGLNCPVVAISNMYHIVWMPAITSSVYKVPNQAVWTFNPPLVLQTNHTVNIYFSCLITSARSSYTNHGSMTWSTGSAITTTPSNAVIVNLPTSITLNKEIKTWGMANYAQYESNHNGALLVNSWDTLSYRITITKTWAALPSVSIADIWPACFSANDASIDSVNISPSLLLTWYPLLQLAVPGPVTVTIILDGIVTPSGNCGIERNTALLSLPAWYPYTILDPWGNQYGISTLAPIQDTADFQLAGYYSPQVNLRIEKTVSPPYTSSHNHNLVVQAWLPFWFTLRFGNTGNVTATGVTITDTLPAWLTCTSYFVNGHGPTFLSWSNFSYLYGSLLPWSTGEISFSCVVNPSIASGSVIINTWYLFYNTTNIFDTASVTVLHNPWFTILKTVNTWTIFSWQVLTYTIHFVNTGSQLNSYYIIDPLSSALTYVPNSATLNGLPRPPVQSGNTLFWWCNAGVSWTNLNNTSVCPLPSWWSGTIVFQALVH